MTSVKKRASESSDITRAECKTGVSVCVGQCGCRGLPAVRDINNEFNYRPHGWRARLRADGGTGTSQRATRKLINYCGDNAAAKVRNEIDAHSLRSLSVGSGKVGGWLCARDQLN